ncbi:MAG: SDR family NAD(P)-dependent oxidoreductase [Pseudomonadota bacterium]
MSEQAKALVLGHSGGIGSAVAAELRVRGVDVEGLARADGLDWTSPASAEEALGRAADSGPFDLVFDATGALIIDDQQPEKKLAAIAAEAMAKQMTINAIGPALILKHYEALLPRDRRSVLATISARVGSIGDNHLGGWISYRAAKAALNQIVRTASVEIARKRPEAICAALHPGTVRTDLSTPITGPNAKGTVSAEEAARNLLAVLDGLRPEDSGGFFAYDGSVIPW